MFGPNFDTTRAFSGPNWTHFGHTLTCTQTRFGLGTCVNEAHPATHLSNRVRAARKTGCQSWTLGKPMRVPWAPSTLVPSTASKTGTQRNTYRPGGQRNALDSRQQTPEGHTYHNRHIYTIISCISTFRRENNEDSHRYLISVALKTDVLNFSVIFLILEFYSNSFLSLSFSFRLFFGHIFFNNSKKNRDDDPIKNYIFAVTSQLNFANSYYTRNIMTSKKKYDH